MFDARAFIDRLEVADTKELADMLRRPSLDEEDALRSYLGDRLYQRLHSLALKLSLQDSTAPKQGNVVVIPGLMGSVLSSESGSEPEEQIWPRFLAIRAGKLDRLMLSGDGRTQANPQFQVRAAGVTKRLYGELMLSLAFQWSTHAFAYDWRKDLDLAARQLAAAISGWFGDDAPVHIVAHSIGGLVARTYLQHYAADRNQSGAGATGGQIIMLGTPNYGSFAYLQAFLGLGPAIQVLDALDPHHDIPFLCRLVSSFPGLYQLLPSPTAPAFTQEQQGFARHFYEADSYRLYGGPNQPCGELDVSSQHLSHARRYRADLDTYLTQHLPGDSSLSRMVYISGDRRPTVGWMGKLDASDPCDYFTGNPDVTLSGDGIVPHTLGPLWRDASKGVPAITTYYVNENHSDLASNPDVLAALDDLLTKGESGDLATAPAKVDDIPLAEDAKMGETQARQQADQATLRLTLARARAWGEFEGARGHISNEERQAEEILTRSVLNYRDSNEESRAPTVPFAPTQISVRLVHGGIESLPSDEGTGQPPIDAVSVGHYVGVFPSAQSPEGILDLAISQALMGDKAQNRVPPVQDRLLWKYVERGTIQGELGQIFLLPDARAPERVIAVVGMGVPGRFGVPELTVMARELCWTLGRLGRRHLATVFIGAGANNLSPEDAVNGWIRGIKYAVSGTPEDETRRLDYVTFIEHDARQIKRFDAAIRSEVARLKQEKRLLIDYTYVPPTTESRQAFSPQPVAVADDDDDDTAEIESPMRVTVTTDRNAYHFGAVTRYAAIPEREIPLDPRLVSDANDQLVAETHLQGQVDRGQFMARLLLPRDLWGQFFTSVPLVMMLDATTARIHWEMIAQPDRLPVADDEVEQSPDDLHPFFLGTSRGFTRQLRTGFAPPPDPPVSQQRLLRVLVVADPAADAHLPGAEEEGVEVADLFESFNRQTRSQNRVEVVRLFGPREASRLNVLHHLINRSYDVLHYAGHCAYDPDNPALSGWVFTGGERISAMEMRRIDRIPGFVFSNACESGITPDRSEMRSVALAPSFAESFFERGVSNFVCTAWPVYDTAARQFALTLYSNLLGLPVSQADPNAAKPTPGDNPKVEADPDAKPTPGDNQREKENPPQPMYRAMQEARKAIFKPEDARTWGAYQHYGNPYFRFFHPSTET